MRRRGRAKLSTYVRDLGVLYFSENGEPALMIAAHRPWAFEAMPVRKVRLEDSQALTRGRKTTM
jgi:hypothetical protein